MTAIADFLLARIAEDEAVVRATLDEHDLLDWTPEVGWPPAFGLAGPVDGPSGYIVAIIDPARVLAECEAKRRIVELHYSWSMDAERYPEPPFGPILATQAHTATTILRSLAAIWADHPDYQQEWAL